MLQKNQLLFEALADQGESRILPVNEDAGVEDFDPSKIYFIKQGVLSTFFQDSELYILQDGDIFLPEFIPQKQSAENSSNFSYAIKFALQVQVFTPSQLSELLAAETGLVQLWIEINALQQFLCNQTIGILSPSEQRPTPEFQCVKAGEIIIHENEDADYVYTLIEGRAIVLHNDTQVGNIEKDEIFGAIAVLINQKRIATVKAEKDCMLLKVHRDEFSKMVHSHPRLFLSLLESLANNIKNMNIKLSELEIKHST